MIQAQQTIANIVLDHSECAEVFQRHHIDFCCRGHMTLEEACHQKGLDMAVVGADLIRAIAERSGFDVTDFREMSTVALIGHIITTHHAYLRKSLPFLKPLAQKVGRVHGETNPRLRELDLIVFDLSDTLLTHLDAEEQDLFPRLMVKNPDIASLHRDFVSMVNDHVLVGNMLSKIRELTDGFVVPDAACNSYRTLFVELKQLEIDTLRHVHLENHVLMPRFVAESTRVLMNPEGM